jgi:3-oxoacyl-(acyl-carrier-protein) synthase
MQKALSNASLRPDAVQYFCADGRATANGDQSEARALQLAFGDHLPHLNVSAPKSMTGGMLSGAGPVDVAFTVLAMQHGVIPPTINVDEQDPACGLNLVCGQPRTTDVSVAMVGARGTGGANSILVLQQES